MGCAGGLCGPPLVPRRCPALQYNNRIRKIAPVTPTASATATATPTATQSSTATQSPSPNCWPSLFRALPRLDAIGSPIVSAASPAGARYLLAATEAACRQACCDAAPACTAYSFADANLALAAAAQCFLLANVTAFVPSNVMASAVLASAYS